VIEVKDTVKTIRIIRRMLPLLLIAAIAPAPAATARADAVEITTTAKGRALLAARGDHARETGRPARSGVRVWEIGPGDYFFADRLPQNFRTHLERDPGSGATSRIVSFDIDARLQAPRVASAATLAAGGPWWLWLDQHCFNRFSPGYGWSDSCYALHGMVNEQDPRDFYSLNQWATLGAEDYKDTALYSGFVDAVRASTSAPMSWIDWKPRSSLSGGCQGVPLSVSALGVSLSVSGVMCENWHIYKSSSPGGFRTTWSCGCTFPFGLQYPATRQAEYAQVVSVPNGGVPRWTISTGFHVR
jgi:hypothetical protein